MLQAVHLSLSYFPVFNVTFDNFENRMLVNLFKFIQVIKFFLVTGFKFIEQVFRFKFDLSSCYAHNRRFEIPIYFFFVKIVISGQCFIINSRQILVNSVNRFVRQFETIKLRMIAITFSFTFKNVFSKKCFTLQSYKSFCV